MKRKLKLQFADFVPGFLKHNTYFLRALAPEFDVELSDRPDVLIYSDYGTEFESYKCKRIYHTAENLRADFSECDYAMTFDHLDAPYHLRLPHYVFYGTPENLIKQPRPFDEILAEKHKFCNFVYSNRSAEKRVEFFHKLSKYKRVDSGGHLMNNVGGPVANKVEFQRNYKFTIAFENAKHPGYTTEKMIHPMYAGSIPIYWGNDLAHRDFNPKSFLSWHDFQSDEALIEQIIEIDNDNDLFRAMVEEPWLHRNELTPIFTGQAFLEFMKFVLDDPKQPVALDPKAHTASRKRLRTIGFTRRIIGRRKNR